MLLFKSEYAPAKIQISISKLFNNKNFHLGSILRIFSKETFL